MKIRLNVNYHVFALTLAPVALTLSSLIQRRFFLNVNSAYMTIVLVKEFVVSEHFLSQGLDDPIMSSPTIVLSVHCAIVEWQHSLPVHWLGTEIRLQ